MSEFRTAIVAFSVVLLLGCGPTKPTQSKRQPGATTNMLSETETYAALLNVLRSGDKSGRIYFYGICDMPNSEIILIPQMQIESPANVTNPTLAIQEMLRSDKDTSVTEDPSGVIRVKGPGVVGQILQTKILNLELDRDSQYDPSAAIRAILNAKDVQSAMQRLRLHAASSIGGLERMPANGMPHVNKSLEGLTVDQALDRIAETFKGIVVYKECKRPDGTLLFNITFKGE